jgi:hypothetical protein
MQNKAFSFLSKDYPLSEVELQGSKANSLLENPYKRGDQRHYDFIRGNLVQKFISEVINTVEAAKKNMDLTGNIYHDCYEMRRHGISLQNIADYFSLSKSRVCHICRDQIKNKIFI